MAEWMHALVAYTYVLCTVDWLQTDIVVLLLANGMQMHTKQNGDLVNDVSTVACPCGLQITLKDCIVCTGESSVKRLHVEYVSTCWCALQPG